ncbi:50S ribosomal protein L25/general stress protein Ctc [Wolbachia endosymbiont of Howardula sp.]|uniref:50S ribosomal protein L25/general stress protein Ctc n=1 Tax=Wolbachia endosymbiont of Howardula sp. TaxID=2916816 RepID=UPI00217CF41E|nr:50S ribosomal protein L25/general stress protein Ctc [Wolbachia endosymbiont of Howardula sp.]UWI83382.1 50S ribosomal protein L25/general stress protein Ctc [Wolbachia endosymbiont of Howardula sp.]
MIAQQVVIIDTEIREVTKKKAIFSLRKRGKIPGIIYGKGYQNINLTICTKEFIKYCKSGALSTHVVILNILDKEVYALVRHIQRHVIFDTIQHVDFQFIDKKNDIKINIPLSFINDNKSPGIRLGGVLNILYRSLTIKCALDNIPKTIEIDLSGKTIGQSIYLSDLKLPEGIKYASSEKINFTIARISSINSRSEELAIETGGAA